MHNLIAESKNEQTCGQGGAGFYKTDVQTYDQSVSLVKMQDSMQFDVMNVTNPQQKKGMQPEIIFEEANEGDNLTGKFDTSDETQGMLRKSSMQHYMMDMGTSARNSPPQPTDSSNHYMSSGNEQRRGSIVSNRSSQRCNTSNRKSGRSSKRIP